jgi:hypothetical protein
VRFLAAILLVTGLAIGPAAVAACLTLASFPDSRRLAQIELPDSDASFSITYMHSVTRTPVTERYGIAGSEIVETEIRFEQHGPGLPTEADAGGTFTQRDDSFVVTMDRHYPSIVMQMHRDQSPRLVAGSRVHDLAQWGNRALELAIGAAHCATQ